MLGIGWKECEKGRGKIKGRKMLKVGSTVKGRLTIGKDGHSRVGLVKQCTAKDRRVVANTI